MDERSPRGLPSAPMPMTREELDAIIRRGPLPPRRVPGPEEPLTLDDARLARELERGIVEHFRGEEGDRFDYQMNACSLDHAGASVHVRRMVIRRLRDAGYLVTERGGGFTVAKP